MKNFVLIFLVFFISFLSFSQKENDSLVEMNGYDSLLNDNIEHYVSLSGLAAHVHLGVGYDMKIRIRDWFKIGTGVSLGFLINKSPRTRYSLIPRSFVEFGYKWFWFEAGIEENYSFNFYAIIDKEKYFDCPYVCTSSLQLYFVPYAGFNFQFGKKFKQQLGLTYNAIFEHNKQYIPFSQHFFGIRYRFQFL